MMKTFSFNLISQRRDKRLLLVFWLIALLSNILTLFFITSTLSQQSKIKNANNRLTALEPLIQTANFSYKVDEIVSANLYGDPYSAEPKTESAPETSLNIKLSGVLSNPNQASARAIISSKTNKEKSYSIRETIVGTTASIVQIRPFEVLLDIDGKIETLSLTKSTAINSQPVAYINEPVPVDQPIPLNQPAPPNQSTSINKPVPLSN